MENDKQYTARLERLTSTGWKRVLDVQRPYRRHIRRIAEGRVLDVGCGIGRNLEHLDGNGVGVDVNPHSVDVARRRGLIAYTPEAFSSSPEAVPGGYGTLLLAHVLEHMAWDKAIGLVAEYLPYLAGGGRIIVIVPQEAGFRSDPTHVAFVGPAQLAELETRLGLRRETVYSFPLPRIAGRVFRHNETVVLCRKPTQGADGR